MIRFIAGIAHPWQLDACDEIGLMVYEESLAGWCLADSPAMAQRFDRSVAEMVHRDRNHPSVVIWGLLNETPDGPVFRHAVESLQLVRFLDVISTHFTSFFREPDPFAALAEAAPTPGPAPPPWSAAPSFLTYCATWFTANCSEVSW